MKKIPAVVCCAVLSLLICVTFLSAFFPAETAEALSTHECEPDCSHHLPADIRTLEPGIIDISPTDDPDLTLVSIYNGVFTYTRNDLIGIGYDDDLIKMLVWRDDESAEFTVLTQEWWHVSLNFLSPSPAQGCSYANHLTPRIMKNEEYWSHGPIHPGLCTFNDIMYWECTTCNVYGHTIWTSQLWCTSPWS